jgi:hypothetical protein
LLVERQQTVVSEKCVWQAKAFNRRDRRGTRRKAELFT